jgi:glutamate-1-semialdehyde 2,1-aminomutase
MEELKKKKIKKIWNKAIKFIPGGNSFLSKNPTRFPSKDWPIYFSKTKGCCVWDLNNNKYFDFSYMGVGTNSLGYSNAKIDNEISKVIKNGNMSTLNSYEEVIFAENILKIHPWAKMAKFAKTGAEANAIALRLARAFTKKNKVIICGYHGWHDWYLSAKFMKNNYMDTHLFPNLKTMGVPNFLKGFTYSVKYNDLNAIRNLLKRDNDISAIIMEVQREELPKKNYLKSIRKICDQNKICLIFDECTTGFREVYGGLHMKYKIYPDLAMFGKAIGNGYSLTTVIGKKSIMKKSTNTFISSTFWSERIGFAAGIATLKEMKRVKSWKLLKEKGKYLKIKLKEIAIKNNLNISFSGLDALVRFKLHDLKKINYNKIITEKMLKKKILAGDVIYLSTAHSKKLIDKYIKEMNEVFKNISLIRNKK